MLQYISVVIQCFLLTTNLLVLYKIFTSWCSNSICLCVILHISIIVYIVTKPILIEKQLIYYCRFDGDLLTYELDFLRNSYIFILLNFICSW